MKYALSILSAFLFLFCQKIESLEKIPCEKNYVQSSQIYLTDHEIFVEMEDVMLSVAAIHNDAQGLYFDTLIASIEPFADATQGWFHYLLPWQCKNKPCSKWNRPLKLNCKYCGSPRPDPDAPKK